jgi:hypothetical protein
MTKTEKYWDFFGKTFLFMIALFHFTRTGRGCSFGLNVLNCKLIAPLTVPLLDRELLLDSAPSWRLQSSQVSSIRCCFVALLKFDDAVVKLPLFG